MDMRAEEALSRSYQLSGPACYWACYFRLWLPVEVDCYRRVATPTWQRVRQVVSCTFSTTIRGRETGRPHNTSLPCRQGQQIQPSGLCSPPGLLTSSTSACTSLIPCLVVVRASL